jgi:hypothetical protein
MALRRSLLQSFLVVVVNFLPGASHEVQEGLELLRTGKLVTPYTQAGPVHRALA